jgi:hypothetical protein
LIKIQGEAFEKKKQSEQSVDSGRAFVESYIDYTHYLERIVQATRGEIHNDEAAEKHTS